MGKNLAHGNKWKGKCVLYGIASAKKTINCAAARQKRFRFVVVPLKKKLHF